ncbi:MAG: hypothetical protein U0840_14525 [Gemmataceae bacterium]
MTAPETLEQLEDLLSTPTALAIETLARFDDDLLLLGVGGKMGPTLARMARRALDEAGVRRRVIGVARFSEPGLEEKMRASGVETIRCNLLDRAEVANLPRAANVLVMVGMKFGATGQEGRTWAINTYLPGLVCERFAQARIVAFSTGNVYGLTPVYLGGSRETDVLQPVGEYAMTAVGRERIYDHFSRTHSQPMALLRLNYATEMRYGVLVDVAQQVLGGQPVDLSMGNLNAVWQGDANAWALCAFAQVQTPPFVVNLAGPETLSVRRVAETFGQLFGKEVRFTGQEGGSALLSNGQLGHRLFGYPRVSAEQMMHWIARWLQRGGPTLGKPTHFENREGRF